MGNEAAIFDLVKTYSDRYVAQGGTLSAGYNAAYAGLLSSFQYGVPGGIKITQPLNDGIFGAINSITRYAAPVNTGENWFNLPGLAGDREKVAQGSAINALKELGVGDTEIAQKLSGLDKWADENEGFKPIDAVKIVGAGLVTGLTGGLGAGLAAGALAGASTSGGLLGDLGKIGGTALQGSLAGDGSLQMPSFSFTDGLNGLMGLIGPSPTQPMANLKPSTGPSKSAGEVVYVTGGESANPNTSPLFMAGLALLAVALLARGRKK